MDMSYATFRKVLATLLRNEGLRKRLNELMAGNQVELTEIGFLDLMEESKVDLDILRILAGREPDEIAPEQAAEVFTAFFSAVRGSWRKLRPLLDALGCRLETAPETG